ncbi:hypothetical protein A2W13_02945 [Candidatus Woesebacteria bacterium RBG_16_36_11]|uniref:Phosphoglycerate kinase n=3 Tax=Candidatus Woeseibacteriota TaxID=1752722 RepID=A0A1F7X7T1_9BACT|nr:MAG: hypothetical protein A2Z67_05380 [Candidatus Woesebacteria bacterium RBG_13_36_22]OGM11117.1 MAG: hypothetical protein A2W13_02945 [Candidatus Woesebacteria bacterium RBG_16_36_11]OGM16603.1 MAG: hypothetical protein A2V55_00575 [Candidatus Woesebacteria bacterium RBG_19FT_COMBO_37_29]
MKLPEIESFDLSQKRVLVRADLDVDLKENYRLKAILPTINYLIERGANILLLGHKGRPQGKDSLLSLRGVCGELANLLNKNINFIEEFPTMPPEGDLVMLENLRFNPQEESNGQEFAQALANLGEFYVNEDFAVSHRVHASIVGLPKLLPHAAGFRFRQEVENLAKVLTNPRKPVVVIIGGVKEDKITYIASFEKFADKILIGGRLPEFIQNNLNQKEIIATLLPDKEDITIHSIENFEEEIAKAGTIILTGPVGKFEEEGHRMGTKRVFEAIAKNQEAFKVAGGGDTVKAINLLNIAQSFDWISVGGGASLEFLAKGTLPGIEALN